MNFLTINLPISGQNDFSVLVLVGIGFTAGVLGGFFGVGGAWIVTPALNIFGFPMAYAIGTDLAHIFGKSIIATRSHGKMKHVDYKLGMLSVTGSLIGMELGKRLVLFLEARGLDEDVVRWVYICMLFAVGVYMVYEFMTTKRLEKRRADDWPKPGSSSMDEPTTLLSAKLRRISIPPMISLPSSGIKRISFWVLFAVFLLAGFTSGLLGIGSGFSVLPSLIYLIGCPTTVAVGTSMLSVCFASGYGCLTYSLSGRTDLNAAIIMLVAAAIGSQIGVLATRYVRGAGIRLLFATMLIMVGVSVVFKEFEGLLDTSVLGTMASYTVMGSSAVLTALVIIRLWMGTRRRDEVYIPPNRPPLK